MNIPNQNTIISRMKKRFGGSGNLVESMIAPCAEEAQRMMYELKENGACEEVTIRLAERRYFASGRNNSKYVRAGYTCTCGQTNISSSFKHCPGCGAQIKWKKY